jgi:hypothetical protein
MPIGCQSQASQVNNTTIILLKTSLSCMLLDVKQLFGRQVGCDPTSCYSVGKFDGDLLKAEQESPNLLIHLPTPRPYSDCGLC